MPERKAISRLEALGGLAAALSHATSRREVADVIVARGRELAGADSSALHVPTSEPGELILLAAHGIDEAVLAQLRRLDASSGHPGAEAMSSGEPVWVETSEEVERLHPAIAKTRTRTRKSQAYWTVPLVSEGQAIGLLGMGFHEPRTFSEDERAFVVTFARVCAMALQRSLRLETERAAKERAESLLASYDTTLRSIGDAVITTDANGRITLLNPLAEQLTGWTEAAALGRPSREVFRIIHERTRAELDSPVDRALATGQVSALGNHTTLIRADGVTETPVEDTCAPIRGTGTGMLGAVLVFRDVSAKKARDARREYLEKATSTLAESLEYEATLANVARLAVPRFADFCSVEIVDEGASTPRQLTVAHVDPAKADLARTYLLRYPPDPSAPVGIHAVLRSGKSELYGVVTDEQLALSAQDAAHLSLLRELAIRSILITPLSLRGRVLGVMTFVQAESGRHYGEEDLAFAEDLARRCATAIDNARLYAAELSARRAAVVASRTKDEFLAIMSHELRTPLSSIMGWSKLLMGPKTDGTMLERGLDVIHRNTVVMGTLIEDLLDLSRITSGKIRLDLRRVDLVKVIETAIEAVRADAQAKKLTISTDLSRDVGAFRGDVARLGQILSNLLSNAVKFTPEGGKVSVALRRSEAGITIEVQDTGKGIDAAFLPHVFEMFAQEEGAAVRSRGGLGLGLAISRQLVELHGGTIRASSEGPGRGARFVVTLPAPTSEPERARPAETPSRTSATHAALPSLAGIRVLTVDDDDDARAFVKAALELRGAIVRTASNVDDALAAIDRELPDVLLSDIGMPLRDGYSLITELRARPPERGGNLPAAAVSAYAYAQDREKALAAGFGAHLAKPVDPGDLVALVQRLAQR